jgi:tetratricopeptide (TPR) repeat protein
MDEIRNTILKVEALKVDKKFTEAISLLQKTLVKYSDDYRLYEELADIYLYIGDNDKAFSALDFSLTLNDQSATGNYLKGFILL